MASEEKRETVVVRLKNILRENNVKLWLDPYYKDGKSVTDELKKLADEYCRVLSIESEQCLEILVEVQSKSLQALQERNRFDTEGLATIRVKISGRRTEFSVDIELTDLVDDLKQKISAEIETPPEKLKLICNGRVLKPEFTLEAQRMKHGCICLVLLLQCNVGEDVLSETKNNHELLEATKKDIEFLANRPKQREFLRIENQIGVNLDIPENERKNLVTAMTLHEKGQGAFKRGEYSLALVFFLEADEEFKRCQSELLQKVDNYGLLNLDIVWTYLHLQSLHYLSNTENRLRICEEALLRSYGSNFERVKSIKGSNGNEQVLFARLHLLQGIMYYFLNKKKESEQLFNMVENEISSIKISDEHVKTLRKLGYGTKEARIALRATFNDPNAAVDYILKCREEKKVVKEFEKIRIFADKHVCMNGAQINLTVLKQLHEMGYTYFISTQALMHCNNEINEALLWIGKFMSNLNNQYPSYIVNVLMSLEFDAKGVRPVLNKYNYNLNEFCLQELLNTTSIGREYMNKLISDKPELLETLTGSIGNASEQQSSTSKPSTSKMDSNPIQDSYDDDRMEVEEIDACNRLAEGLSDSQNDYFDSNLESEEKFLKLYKSYLV